MDEDVGILCAESSVSGVTVLLSDNNSVAIFEFIGTFFGFFLIFRTYMIF